MLLTSDVLAEFKGGHLIMNNRIEHYTLYGDIEDVVFEYETIVKVHFAWLTKINKNHGAEISIQQHDCTLTFSTDFFFIEEVGDGSLRLFCLYTSESATFIPPRQSAQSRATIEGTILEDM